MPSKTNRKVLLDVPHSRANGLQFIHEFVASNDVTNKVVVDVSAGTGYVANLWHEAGAKVLAFDKYPELFKPTQISCTPINLDEVLPIESNTADYVLLMETIEHIPNQYQLLEELSRILKPNGLLIITKPNNSNLSGRMANFFLEAERSDMFLPNEESIIGYDNFRRYNPRIFLCGIMKLRTMAHAFGLKTEKVYENQLSVSSLIWYVFFGIFFHIRTLLTYKKTLRKTKREAEKAAIREQYLLNMNPTILLHKHLCITFRKKNEI